MKTKKQIRQEQRLNETIRERERNNADLTDNVVKKTSKLKEEEKPPKKKAGFFKRLLSFIFGTDKPPQTAQASIPYEEMYRDGICRVKKRFYTKTIVFHDINYQLAQNDAKTHIFEDYCNFLNYFDSTIRFQLSFINKFGNIEDFKNAIKIEDQKDGSDFAREEYTDMLQNQLAKGNNGLVKTKFITFGIEAKTLRDAKMRIERIEVDILANFKTMGVTARPLTGAERLEILHGQFNSSIHEKFHFDWRNIVDSGLSTKDFIAPTSFDFRDGKTFRMGTEYGAVSYVQIIAPELTDRMLADFLDMDNAITVNIHIQSIDQNTAIKMIKRKLSDLDKMKIDEQKKANRSGYDMDSATRSLITE